MLYGPGSIGEVALRKMFCSTSDVNVSVNNLNKGVIARL